MHVVNDGLHYVIFFVIPLAALEFDLSFAQASLIKTFFSLFCSLLQYPCAILADAAGGVGLLALATAWAGLGIIVMGLSTGIWTLWLSTAGAGMGGSAQHPVASSLISGLYPAHRRGSAMGILNFGGDVGKVVFAGMMSLLLTYLNWRQALHIVGLGTVVFSAAWFTIAKRVERQSNIYTSQENINNRSLQHTKPETVASTSGGGLESPPEPNQGRRFVVLSAIGMLDNCTRATLLTFLPFLYLAKGVNKESLGIYLTVVAVGGLFGKLGCGIVADYFGNMGTILVTEVLTAAFILLCPVSDPKMGLLLAAFLGFFLNGTSSVIYSQAASVIPISLRTRGYAAFFTFTMGSAAIVPLLFGLLGDLFHARFDEWTGLVAIFIGMAAMTALIIPLAVVFYALGRSEKKNK